MQLACLPCCAATRSDARQALPRLHPLRKHRVRHQVSCNSNNNAHRDVPVALAGAARLEESRDTLGAPTLKKA